MKTIMFNSISTLIFIALIFSYMGCGKQKADLVLKNGIIYTVDENNSKAEAIAIAGDKILAVGSNADIEEYVDDNTQVIDLQRKTVVPGFVDAHYHFLGVGRREFQLNLDGTRSLEEFLARVKAEAEKTPEGEWIRGRGWIEEDWLIKEFPTRWDLDKVAPNHLVFLGRADGHSAVVNSLTLQKAGITKDTPDPEGGQILRDPSTGEPNGMLLDNAMELVTRLMPPDTSEEMIRKYARKANDIAIAYGLTQIHDMGTSWRTVEILKDMVKKGELKLRLHEYIRGPGKDADRLLEEGPQIGLFNHRLTVRGIKITIDGALGSRGAVLLEPYRDADTRGFFTYKDEEIYPTIKKALEKGIQMAIHA
ncbi:MAG: amidohydrolase, partial [Calditrichaeota bacterium]